MFTSRHLPTHMQHAARHDHFLPHPYRFIPNLNQTKLSVKLSPCEHDVIWGRRSTVPLILHLDTRWSASRPGRFTRSTQWTEGWVGIGAGLKTNLAPTSEVRTVSGDVLLTSGSATFCPVRVAKQGGVPKTPTDRTVHTKSEVAACTPHRFRKPLIFIWKEPTTRTRAHTLQVFNRLTLPECKYDGF